MLDPHFLYSVSGPVVMGAWFVLLVGLFVAKVRPVAIPVARMIVPALLAIAYALLIWTGFGEAEGGGFGSIAEIRALFASDSALVAGWFHYLAFDLFVGAWIVEDGTNRRVPRLLLLPCLPLTFLFGPTGLLLYFILRLAFARRAQPETV